MNQTPCADVVLYVCHNCMPPASRLPRQWRHNGLLVETHEVPCSGKTDVQYLFHALEAGARALCVVTCPQGECRLAQGNYRAQIRIETVRRLMAEIGLDPERAAIVRCPANETPDRFNAIVHEALDRFAAVAAVGAQ